MRALTLLITLCLPTLLFAQTAVNPEQVAQHYIGLALLLTGICCLLLDIILFGSGLLGIGGFIAVIVGYFMLFDIHQHSYLDWTFIVIISLLTLIFFLLVLRLVVKSHKKTIVTGAEGLIGSTGVVLSVIQHQVVVRVLGEIWEAKSKHKLHVGQDIKVTAVTGLLLTVVPSKEEFGDLS